jgi:hypothetical protein
MAFENSSGNAISNLISSGTAAGVVVGAVFSFLPPVAALVALVWYFIQIWESATVRAWIAKRRTRKLARMKAEVIMLEARMRPPLDGPELKS